MTKWKKYRETERKKKRRTGRDREEEIKLMTVENKKGRKREKCYF